MVDSPTSAPGGPRNDSPRGVTAETESPRRGSASALIVLGASLFGTTGTAVARVPGGADPLTTGSLRLLFGGAILALMAARRLHSLSAVTTPVAIGAVLVSVYQLAFFWAVVDTGVAVSTLTTIGASPLVSRFIGIVRRRPAPPGRWLLSAAILLVGLLTLVLGGYEDVQLRPVGIAAAAFAGAAFAGYTECAAVAIERHAHPDAVLAAFFLGAGLITSPVLLVRPLDVLDSATGLLVLLHLAVVTLALAYVAFGRGLRHVPPTSATMLTMAEPLVATALAVALLGEKFSSLGWFGAVIVMIGLVMVATVDRETRTTVRT